MYTDEATNLLYNIIAGAIDDLYGAYRDLLALSPVLKTEMGAVVLSRFGDIDAALKDRRLGKATEVAGGRTLSGLDPRTVAALAENRRSMMFANPPDHTRLRRQVAAVFTPRHVEILRGAIEARARSLMADLPETGDFVSAVGLPLPVNVISDLLGIPESDRMSFVPLVHDVAKLLEPMITSEVLERALDARTELNAYFATLLNARRRQPADDLLSRLAACREADALDDAEMVTAATILFGAGMETTVKLLSNGLWALLQHPDQLSILRGRPELMPRAVEEMLRFYPPIQLDGRIALEPAEVAGVPLETGQIVMMMLGAANRDPMRFTNPDRFDVMRDEGGNLALGAGIHFCLGAHLVRIEAEVTFRELLTTYRHIEADGEPTFHEGFTLHGLTSLPVRVR